MPSTVNSRTVFARSSARLSAFKGASALWPANRLTQEAEAECSECRALLVVLAVAVPAIRRLVEIRLVAHSLQLRSHLARVARVNAVVTPRGRQQDRRVLLARRGVVVGRIGLQKRPIFRLIWIAVLGDPARSSQQLRIAAHIDQRNSAKERAKTL